MDNRWRAEVRTLERWILGIQYISDLTDTLGRTRYFLRYMKTSKQFVIPFSSWSVRCDMLSNVIIGALKMKSQTLYCVLAAVESKELLQRVDQTKINVWGECVCATACEGKEAVA